ncbi:hypothetical protein FHX48_000553 [Microbacterium halimionae]|uniref:HNH nuclease domain-containing protein n=1 Tax=Microbacterium halimionae TaxID=1526413 RepID=A0A7W3PL05_9MICO|nr:HNH endonuclease signature motif containing protein [Microbacterium halimionae]MBA8815501.1 hypothetical protein [Microbacterium halimionae]NII95548.1 hypothetical protein [Microbacterium halimionae]
MEFTAASPTTRLAAASARVVEVFRDDEFSRAVAALEGEVLLAVLTNAAEARNALDLIVATASAEVGHRSTRDRGYDGLAQRKGHRNGTSLVQNITGQSRGDVNRALRTGEELAPSAFVSDTAVVGDTAFVGEAAVEDADPIPPRWLTLLRGALSGGLLSSAQFRAIRVSLGEPPIERYPERSSMEMLESWAAVVEQLLAETSTLPVEELRAAARIARDRLDPVGVTLRFEERFEARSFRTWIDEHGQHHARVVFDDDGAAWVHSIQQAARRPRRGPRFVPSDPSERAAVAELAAEIAADQRSNEQLQYDTILAILRTGAGADPRQAFGDRQPGVRILVEAAAITRSGERGQAHVSGAGHVEDGGAAVPGGVVESYLCDAGAVPITQDTYGRPLDVGREHRLFTRKQRVAIAARDGGCMWPSCVAPISQCEFHHVDHWWQDHGSTNVDDGVPLCRNCHLRLHNQQWKTRRERSEAGDDAYWLHAPPNPATGEVGEPVRLASKSPLRFTAA